MRLQRGTGVPRCVGGTDELEVLLRKDMEGWHFSGVEGEGKGLVGQGMISQSSSRSKMSSLIEVRDPSRTWASLGPSPALCWSGGWPCPNLTRWRDLQGGSGVSLRSGP